MNDSTNPIDLYDLQTYNYYLPAELIAQNPVEPRDSSRLLVLNRQTGHLEDRTFRQIADYLEPGDALVVNQTRVLPARLMAYKPTGAQIEILLLKDCGGYRWEALVKPARRMQVGTRVRFLEGLPVEAVVIDKLEMNGGRLLQFYKCSNFTEFIHSVGMMPLPPYIKRPSQAEDHNRYQTVYAQESGSAAAPTAGLHFTDGLLQDIADKGVNIIPLTLHVGLGTFRPVSSQDIRHHHMHSEYFAVPSATADILNLTRQRGNKVVGVGTTVVRTLESAYEPGSGYQCRSGNTNIFIYPGYEIKSVDRMITNFHLPGSSLIMLVAALAGLDNTKRAYQHAIDMHYRFFSYGDAMLII